LTNHHATKLYGGVEVQFHAFLTLALKEVGGQLHALATLPLAIKPMVPTAQEDGWEPEIVQVQWQRENFPAPTGN